MKRGSLYAVCSGLFYGLVGYFGISIMDSGIPVFGMLFWRFLFSGLIVACVLVYVKQRVKFSWLKLLLASMFYCGGTAIYFMASRYIGSGLAMVLFFTYPMMVIFFNLARGHIKMSKAYFLGILLLICGLFFLMENDQIEFDMFGVALAVLAAASYATYIIFSKGSINLPPLSYAFAVSIGSAIICFTLALEEVDALMPSSSETWLNLVIMSIFCTVVPILFLLESFKSIPAERAAILTVLEPVFVVIAGVMLLGEELSIFQGLGVIIILTAAIVVSLDKKQAQQE